MAFNTGNPLGSTDPRDFSDNSENFDNAVNNTASATWTDRFGNSRASLAGQVGYIGTGTGGAIESYASGLVLTTYSTIILYSGEFYRPSSGANLPYTTTATTPDVDSNLVAVGDAVLRQDLANSAAGFGSELVSRSVLQKKSVSEVEALTGTINNIVYLDSAGRSGHFYWDASNLSTEVTADTQQGIYIAPSSDPTGTSGAWVRQDTSNLTPEMFGADPSVADNSVALIAAFDSGYNIDGAWNTYPITSAVVTTTTGAVRLRRVKIQTPLEVSTDQVDFSSATELHIEGFEVVSTLSGLSDYSVTDAQAARGWKYHRSDDGVAYLTDILVKDYKGQACSVDKVAVVFINNVRAQNTGMGQRFTAIQAGFANGVRTIDARRIGVTFQSATNAVDHDDLQVSNLSVDNIYPGIGAGADENGIGVEIHNFVDEALATNIRARNCHSMGISLSGCEHGNVRNLFVRRVGYTSESVATPYNRGFAGIEIVDSDAATAEGSIIDVWQSFVRFDKSHFARVNLICEQNDSDVSGAFRFIRYQGTANDFNNSAWSCVAQGIYRNNTALNLNLLDIGTFATFLEYRHKLENMTVFNCTIAPSGNFRIRNLVIEDDGTLTNATGIGTLFDLNGAGDDIDISDIEYIGVDTGNTPDAFCRVSSGSLNNFVGRNLVIRNVDSVLTAASGTLAEMALHDCQLFDVNDLYTGTISSSFRLAGSDNYASPRVPLVPTFRHGNNVTGVSGQEGDIMHKYAVTTGVSMGWKYDGAAWVPMPNMS